MIPSDSIPDIISNNQINVIRLVNPGYIGGGGSTGSGCIINKQYGLLVTNVHIANDIRQLNCHYLIKTSDNKIISRYRNGRVLYCEPYRDLALVSLEFTGSDDKDNELTDQFVLADQKPADFGEQLICIGYPKPYRLQSMTLGYVCCGRRTFNETMFSYSVSSFIHHSSGTISGYSGGPLIDEMGRLAGIHHIL
ncbi:probable serine protease do-like [Oppia nitens]|uniref:probable serine protease do-like n=1 Tax=Oppia nitens TaxID=1686743 RepID=UPI0023DC98E3|nr:probable serine protease do-like [Oppia nitens]